tara:strand:+ start:516 stop:701 length:186 start_codon:yes stop_codon:yes gene_type:complete
MGRETMSDEKQEQMGEEKKRSYQAPEVSEEEVFERGVLIGGNKTPAEAVDDADCDNDPVAS